MFTVSGSDPTCAHGHGCPGYHPHGSHAVVARSRYRDGGRVEGCRGDAVRLHHGGVMDHMWLSRIHWLGVIRSLLIWKDREGWWGLGRVFFVNKVNHKTWIFILFNGSLRGWSQSFSTAGTREVNRKHSANQHHFLAFSISLPAFALFFSDIHLTITKMHSINLQKNKMRALLLTHRVWLDLKQSQCFLICCQSNLHIHQSLSVENKTVFKLDFTLWLYLG